MLTVVQRFRAWTHFNAPGGAALRRVAGWLGS